MNISNILIAICSLMFFMIGADKFLLFLEPPCTLQDSIPAIVWKVLGVLQLVAGVLIWLPTYRKYVVGFFTIFMLVFAAIHVSQGTYDIGGAVLMAVLLGILVWNPGFIRGKK